MAASLSASSLVASLAVDLPRVPQPTQPVADRVGDIYKAKIRQGESAALMEYTYGPGGNLPQYANAKEHRARYWTEEGHPAPRDLVPFDPRPPRGPVQQHAPRMPDPRYFPAGAHPNLVPQGPLYDAQPVPGNAAAMYDAYNAFRNIEHGMWLVATQGTR